MTQASGPLSPAAAGDAAVLADHTVYWASLTTSKECFVSTMKQQYVLWMTLTDAALMNVQPLFPVSQYSRRNR